MTTDPRSLRSQLARGVPALAVALAVAVWVAAVPSRNPTTLAAGNSLRDVAGGAAGTQAAVRDGETGPSGVAVDTGGPGATTGGAAAGGNAAGAKATASTTAKRVVGGTAATGFTGEDCTRLAIQKVKRCRPTPPFTGDNGGATHAGVTKTTVKVVAYQPKNNAQVQTILAQAGTATDADREGAGKALTAWFNKNYELYGRKVEFQYFVGSSAAADAAGQQADAVKVATELKAFAVLTTYAGPSFYNELHRRGVIAMTWSQFAEKTYESLSPHLFGVFPDRDITLGHLAEYVCKRLAGKPAVHAGDPTYQTTVRKLGIVYQDETDNGPFLEKQLKTRCGLGVTKMLSYPPDIGNAVAISTNAVTQLQEAGVTTVTCVCDPVAPIFFTGQATKQGWLPEWLHNGYMVTDADAAGRLYEPTQWGHSFGVSTIPVPGLLKDDNGFRVCTAGGGSHQNCQKGTASYYAGLALIFGALEAVGPKVTDRSVAEMFVKLEPTGGTRPNEARVSLGRDPGFYTLLDDTMEIWYDPNRTGNDGKRGASFLVQSGRRYLAGDWPATPPVVFKDDGSPQPPRDPDRG